MYSFISFPTVRNELLVNEKYIQIRSYILTLIRKRLGVVNLIFSFLVGFIFYFINGNNSISY